MSEVKSIDTEIEQARQRLALKPSKPVSDEVEAADPDVINALLAKASELDDTEKAAKREREKITALLTEIIGEPDGDKRVLLVHGAPVFSVSLVVSRGLDQAQVKSEFPDIADNARFYKDAITTRRNYL